MKSSMSTWMKVGVILNHLELLEELTPQLSLTRRIPAAASPQRRSILLDAMSSALLQPPAPPCLLTGAPQQPQGRRMAPETAFHLGLPLRTQARHCHWGTPHFPTLSLTLNRNPLFLPIPLPSQTDPLPFPHLSVPLCKKEGVGLQSLSSSPQV